MAGLLAFQPQADTVNINVSASSQRVKLGVGSPSVRICNNGTQTVWIKTGDSTVTADTTTCIPIPGNGFTEVLIPKDQTAAEIWIAVIAAGATGIVYFTPGVGL